MKLWKVAVVLAAVAMFSVSANAQDTCATAVDVSVPVDPCLDGTPTGPLGSCTSGGGLNDMWLTFVATATEHRVRTDVSSAGTDSDYIVYSGTCGNLTEIGCSEDEAAPFNGDICVGGLIVGDTYIIQLGGWGDFCSGTYTVDIEAIPPSGGAACGDDIVSCVPGAEVCDGTDAAACIGLCQADCTCPTPICGNGVLEAGEECDDGNTVNGDGCDDCVLVPTFVPAISEWGLVVMVLIGLVAGTGMFGRKRAATA